MKVSVVGRPTKDSCGEPTGRKKSYATGRFNDFFCADRQAAVPRKYGENSDADESSLFFGYQSCGCSNRTPRYITDSVH